MRDIKKDKNTHVELMEELRTKNDLLLAIIDGTDDVAFVMDLQDRYVYINSAGGKFFDMSPTEIIGKTNKELFPPEAASKIMEYNQKVISSGKTIEVEESVEMNGRTFTFFSRKAPYHGVKGNIIGIVCITRDITERNKAEKRLIESEQLLKYVLDASNDAIFVIEPETSHFLYFNDKAITSFGYVREELMNLGFVDVETLLPNLSSWKQFVNVLKERQSLSFDGKVKRNDGTVFPVDVNAKYTSHDTKDYIIAVVCDVTERKKVEEERDRFFNKSIDMLCIAGFDGNFKQLNPAWTITFGWSIDELLSRPWLSFVHPDDQQSTIEAGEQLQDGKSVIEFENRYQCRDGKYRWISWNSFPIMEKKQIFAVARDVTQRKKMEEESVIYQKRLKHLSSVLSLTEERERRHISEDLHDRIGQALAVIKMKLEELRNPQVETDSGRVLNETGALLDNAIQDTRTLTFEISPPLLYELGFESAVEWLIEQFRERHNIPIEYESNGNGSKLDDDVSFFLFKSVRELLFNVIKHARADRVKVSVRREKKRIRISIQDDGEGFDSSKVKFSVNDLSGFGLFSMRERMELFGGDFDVESKPGQGSRITLIMPLKPEEEDWIK